MERGFVLTRFVSLASPSCLRPKSVARRPSQKLAKRYFGPFHIVRPIGHVAYELDLPSEARIHPVFHVSLLREYKGRIPPLITVDLPPSTIGATSSPPTLPHTIPTAVNKRAPPPTAVALTRNTTSSGEEHSVSLKGTPQSNNTSETQLPIHLTSPYVSDYTKIRGKQGLDPSEHSVAFSEQPTSYSRASCTFPNVTKCFIPHQAAPSDAEVVFPSSNIGPSKSVIRAQAQPSLTSQHVANPGLSTNLEDKVIFGDGSNVTRPKRLKWAPKKFNDYWA